MFWCTLVFPPTDYVLNHKNDVLQKRKLPKLFICQKLTLRTPWGLLKVVQSENIWRGFYVLTDNFEQVSQLPSRVHCRLWAFFACKTFHSIQHRFHKTNILRISWFFISYYVSIILVRYHAVMKFISDKPPVQSRFKSYLFGLHVSMRFSGSKFLINLRRQFRVRRIFRTHVFARFLFCV